MHICLCIQCFKPFHSEGGPVDRLREGPCDAQQPPALRAGSGGAGTQAGSVVSASAQVSQRHSV